MRSALAASLAAFPLLFACQPETAPTPAPQAESHLEVAMPDVAGTLRTIDGPRGPVTLEVKNGTYVFQGDIVLTEQQVDLLRGAGGKQSAAVTPNAAGLATLQTMWPFQTVYFAINGTLPDQARVTNAIAHWQANTNLRFVQRTTQPNFVEFVRGSGCSSKLGMVGGRQEIVLANNCTMGNVIHEIGHAVGLLHEHTRQDRDSFIRINWGNILAGQSDNFQRYDLSGINGFDSGGFDFGSVMMYDSFAHTANGQATITRLDGTTFGSQRNGLAAGDLQLVNWMYGGLFARVESFITYQSPDWNLDETQQDFSVTFWADRNMTIPATLGTSIRLEYSTTEDRRSWGQYQGATTYNYGATLQPGSHSYYLGNWTTSYCRYGAMGGEEGDCTSLWLRLRDGFGYAVSQ
jgi:hypothetical protein